MNSQMVQLIPYNEGSDPKQKSNAREILKKYIFHWPLFISFLAISFGIAFLYVKYADRIYNVRAQLLFKDEQTGNGQRESALQELDIVSSNKMVENEMEILKSRMLMIKVVNDLELWTSYQKVGIVTDEDLYYGSPVKISLLKKTGDISSLNIVVRIKDSKSYILKQSDRESEFLFSSKIKTSAGVWAIKPTPHLKTFIGETIRINVKNPNLVASGILNNFYTDVISKQATVVEMSLKETIPERGRDILNRLIEVYNLAAVQDNNLVTESTLKFIDERLLAVTNELNNVEKEVEQFKSSKGLTDIASQSNFYLQNVTANDRSLNEVNVGIEVLNGIEKYVNSPESARPPATVGISDPALSALVNQMISLQSQRDRLLATTHEGNPMFDPINRQLNTTRESIRGIIKGIKTSLISTRRQLELYDSHFVSSIKDLPNQERQYLVMQRQQEIKEELYTYLLKKREEAALSYASTLSNSRIVEKATYGPPISPRIPRTYALAFVIGLVLPAGFIYGRDLLNNKVLDSEEVTTTTAVPILGELILHDGPKVIVIKDRSCRVIAEQFRALRTNLQFLQGSLSNSRVIMLTSSMSGEGKSFITSNLGAAFSASGRKTIVLEMDLRKPTISKYFGQNGAPGLSNFLQGEVLMEEIIQPVDGHSNLYVIGAGDIPSNPSEILEDPRLKELVEWLRSNFDEILIDTPPVQLVTDGMIISQYCDIHLYVVRQGFTYKSNLEYLKQLDKDKKLTNLRIIFNGVDIHGRYSYKTDVDYGYYNDDGGSSKRITISIIKNLAKRF